MVLEDIEGAYNVKRVRLFQQSVDESQMQGDQLHFDSRFECGNLHAAYRVTNSD